MQFIDLDHTLHTSSRLSHYSLLSYDDLVLLSFKKRAPNSQIRKLFLNFVFRRCALTEYLSRMSGVAVAALQVGRDFAILAALGRKRAQVDQVTGEFLARIAGVPGRPGRHGT